MNPPQSTNSPPTQLYPRKAHETARYEASKRSILSASAETGEGGRVTQDGREGSSLRNGCQLETSEGHNGLFVLRMGSKEKSKIVYVFVSWWAGPDEVTSGRIWADDLLGIVGAFGGPTETSSESRMAVTTTQSAARPPGFCMDVVVIVPSNDEFGGAEQSTIRFY